MEVTIAVATFGEEYWITLARRRAILSARDQGAPVLHLHGETLAGARNACLAAAETEFVIFCDADDSLGAGYVEAMATGSADLRAPAVTYVQPNGRASGPRVPRVVNHEHDCEGECLLEGNFIAIGAAARRELLIEVGGFREWPAWEDWEIFLRCYLAGASTESIPSAIYRAHVRRDSRNTGFDQRFADRLHRRILEANLPELAA